MLVLVWVLFVWICVCFFVLLLLFFVGVVGSRLLYVDFNMDIGGFGVVFVVGCYDSFVFEWCIGGKGLCSLCL